MKTQYKKVFISFFEAPKSRLMASFGTEVMIQNVCRYVDMMRDNNQIVVVKLDYCAITNQLVEYLTTNPKFFPPKSQLDLFE
ncbi:hypothetical protein [Winogradskyella sp. MH6]|uniref:hypothetical protein n=1 Tax=Winogradskyella sp. MH6 TaxID=2929510 RepID=UPI001FB454C4|nr:hypothetical protein [Winogradskyella sp. MH6]